MSVCKTLSNKRKVVIRIEDRDSEDSNSYGIDNIREFDWVLVGYVTHDVPHRPYAFGGRGVLAT